MAFLEKEGFVPLIKLGVIKSQVVQNKSEDYNSAKTKLSQRGQE